MPSIDPVSSITNCYRLIVSVLLTQYTASSSRNAQLNQLDLVFERNCQFANLNKYNMQYKPYNSALLAQETLFSAVKKALFLPEVFKKRVNRNKS